LFAPKISSSSSKEGANLFSSTNGLEVASALSGLFPSFSASLRVGDRVLMLSGIILLLAIFLL
jgi:hypothetical protein